MKAFKRDGSRWFAPTLSERYQELDRAADAWCGEQIAAGVSSGVALDLNHSVRAVFEPIEAKVRELVESPAFAEAVMRGVCPYCGAACADLHDETGLVTLHQAPPCERFANLRPVGGATVTVEFVGYLFPPSPGIGVHLFGDVAGKGSTS